MLLPFLPSLQEVEQKLNGVTRVRHFISAISVIIKRRSLEPTEFQLLFQGLNRPVARNCVHGSSRNAQYLCGRFALPADITMHTVQSAQVRIIKSTSQLHIGLSKPC